MSGLFVGTLKAIKNNFWEMIYVDPRHLFIDERLTGHCIYCGAEPDTREHIPSKVLLDSPYPPQLPVVGACKKCNHSFSVDEQYVASFIECARCGSVEAQDIKRPKIKNILSKNPVLRQRILECRWGDIFGNFQWKPEIDRVKNISIKLAQGHVAYELYPKFDKPGKVSFFPLYTLTKRQRAAFETISYVPDLLPEIGSRAFLKTYINFPKSVHSDWTVVQPERYRYAVGLPDGDLVRIVFSEYFACEVIWDEEF